MNQKQVGKWRKEKKWIQFQNLWCLHGFQFIQSTTVRYCTMMLQSHSKSGNFIFQVPLFWIVVTLGAGSFLTLFLLCLYFKALYLWRVSLWIYDGLKAIGTAFLYATNIAITPQTTTTTNWTSDGKFSEKLEKSSILFQER